MTDEKLCSEHSGICRNIKAIEKEIDLRFTSLEKVTQNTKHDLEKRLETMNEFRAQLDKQAKTFAPKVEIDLRLANHEIRMDKLSSDFASIKNWLIGLLVAVVINLVGVLIVLIK